MNWNRWYVSWSKIEIENRDMNFIRGWLVPISNDSFFMDKVLHLSFMPEHPFLNISEL